MTLHKSLCVIVNGSDRLARITDALMSQRRLDLRLRDLLDLLRSDMSSSCSILRSLALPYSICSSGFTVSSYSLLSLLVRQRMHEDVVHRTHPAVSVARRRQSAINTVIIELPYVFLFGPTLPYLFFC